jgi:Glucokinase
MIPTGGLYVTGGLTPKNIEWIEGEGSCFMKAYWDKGRVTPILKNVPLFAVMTEDLGVRGAVKNARLVSRSLFLERCGKPAIRSLPIRSSFFLGFVHSTTILRICFLPRR